MGARSYYVPSSTGPRKGYAMRFATILRVWLIATVFGAIFGIGAIGAPGEASAEAGPICASADVSSVAGDRSVGPVCVPYSGSVLCHWVTVTGGTLVVVTASACHPW